LTEMLYFSRDGDGNYAPIVLVVEATANGRVWSRRTDWAKSKTNLRCVALIEKW